jgi:N-terminal domain of NWD NACHT-NTPase
MAKDAQLKFTIRKTEVSVKKQVEKIAGVILFAKHFISAAASTEPHAALAWAGISILLPVSSRS